MLKLVVRQTGSWVGDEMGKIKSVFLLLIALAAMAMSGCDKISTILKDLNDIPPKEKNPAYLTVYDSAEIEMNFLIDAIARKDAQVIKDQFSPYAKDNISDFDAKIDRLIEEFPGCSSFEISAGSAGRNKYGTKEDAYMPTFDFTVDGKEYRMLIVYYVRADFDETKLGWHLIQLYDQSDPTNSPSMYLHDQKDDPDILLWDYTKEQ